MEGKNAPILFSKSVKEDNMIYDKYISDGDTKVLAKVNDVYKKVTTGNTTTSNPVTRIPCWNHYIKALVPVLVRFASTWPNNTAPRTKNMTAAQRDLAKSAVGSRNIIDMLQGVAARSNAAEAAPAPAVAATAVAEATAVAATTVAAVAAETDEAPTPSVEADTRAVSVADPSTASKKSSRLSARNVAAAASSPPVEPAAIPTIPSATAEAARVHVTSALRKTAKAKSVGITKRVVKADGKSFALAAKGTPKSEAFLFRRMQKMYLALAVLL